MKLSKDKLRKWSRTIHRDLSFFFAGMVLIYAMSGIFMNHRDSINPHYVVENVEGSLNMNFTADSLDKAAVLSIMEQIGVSHGYTKHYFPNSQQLKVFLKGGSTLVLDLTDGTYIYETLTRRPLISQMTKLHYNPGRWWTWFSDCFAVALILITITGIVMMKGTKGLWGRGGIELLIGLSIPVILFLLN